MNNRKYITRLAYENSAVRGWWVRIPRLNKSKLFSDNIYGGTEAAELAARVWRDKLIREAPSDKSATADTGVEGININFRQGKKKVLAYLSIDIARNQERLQATISLNKRGLRPALWDAARRIGAFLEKTGEGDMQKIASDIFSKSFSRIEKILDKHKPRFEKPTEKKKPTTNAHAKSRTKS